VRQAAKGLALLALIAIGGTGCSSSSKSSGAPSTSSTGATTLATRELKAVLDDTGLHLPACPLEAADYRVTFTDERSNRPAGQTVALRLRPSGPDVTILEVPAGQTRESPVIQNVVAYVALDGKDARVPVDHQLDVVATKQYPVPAT
jgi:hypothetical protein